MGDDGGTENEDKTKCVMCGKGNLKESYSCAAPKCNNHVHKKVNCSGHIKLAGPWFCRGTCYHNYHANHSKAQQDSRRVQHPDEGSLYIGTVSAQGQLLYKRHDLWEMLRTEVYDVLVVTEAAIHASQKDDHQACVDSSDQLVVSGERWRFYDYAHYDLWHSRPSSEGGVAIFTRRRLQAELLAIDRIGDSIDLIMVHAKSCGLNFVALNRHCDVMSKQSWHSCTKRVNRLLKQQSAPKLIIMGHVGVDYWRNRDKFEEFERDLGLKQQIHVSTRRALVLPGPQIRYASCRPGANSFETAAWVSDPTNQNRRDNFEAHFNQICDQFECASPELSKKTLSQLSHGQKQSMQLGFKLALTYFSATVGQCADCLFSSTNNATVQIVDSGLDPGLLYEDTAPKLVWAFVKADGSHTEQPTGTGHSARSLPDIEQTEQEIVHPVIYPEVPTSVTPVVQEQESALYQEYDVQPQRHSTVYNETDLENTHVQNEYVALMRNEHSVQHTEITHTISKPEPVGIDLEETESVVEECADGAATSYV